MNFNMTRGIDVVEIRGAGPLIRFRDSMDQPLGANHRDRLADPGLLILYECSTSICALCSLPLKSMYTDFHSEKTSSAAVPASRCPLPVCFVPPNGRCTSAPMVGALT